MKTETIFQAMKDAEDRCSYYFYRHTDYGDNTDKEHLKAIRQYKRFHSAVLSRIEQGDRAIGWMNWIEYELLTDPNVNLEKEIKDVIKWYRSGK